MYDLHSHLLPGIDDGVNSFEKSLEILTFLSSLGIKKVFVTPHYVTDTNYASPRFENERLFSKLQAYVKDSKINIELFLGNELYIDRDLSKLLKLKKISSLANTKYLLVELPMSGDYEGYEDILYSLICEGYQIILAHPERYLSFQKNYETVKKLSNLGILFQSNIGSIVGQYGRPAQKTVKKLIKDDLIFAFGTDVHNTHHFTEYEQALKKLKKLYGDRRFIEVSEKNPQTIFHN
ncbi:hypothetical protein IKF63_00830 [Candidatus Saccharibacteria bacterium]|nr:hypothetical protein [Candidatus Saccharibacteria bacterium]